MKSIVKLFIVALLSGSLAVPTLNTISEVSKTASKTEYCYLIAGLDDAAQNTDVLVILYYDSESNESSVLQIPRDTYCNLEGNDSKINHLYAHYRTELGSSEIAMEKTADFIGEIFGTTFDGYVAITTNTFRNAVDSIGGVWVNLPDSFIYNSKDASESFVLPKGENLLDGNKSEIFVRHRKSYALGDLGRIDAQKIFFGGLYTTITERIGFDKLIKLALSFDKGMITDFSFAEAAVMFIKNFSKMKYANVAYVTVPGEAFKHKNGLWYYVLNKKACEKLLSESIFPDAPFDPKRICTDSDEAQIERIYYDENITYRVYGQGDISNIKIPGSLK